MIEEFWIENRKEYWVVDIFNLKTIINHSAHLRKLLEKSKYNLRKVYYLEKICY